MIRMMTTRRMRMMMRRMKRKRKRDGERERNRTLMLTRTRLLRSQPVACAGVQASAFNALAGSSTHKKKTLLNRQALWSGF